MVERLVHYETHEVLRAVSRLKHFDLKSIAIV